MELSVDRITVLHVDDDSDFTDLTRAFLEERDGRFIVRTATSASEGLQHVSDDVDCIVSDYDMPGQNGVEFLKRVRQEYSELPFILFTGKGSELVASDAISAGVTDYLQKQPGTNQYTLLANRIANSVGSYRSRQYLQQHKAELETTYERIEFALEATDSYIYEIDLETGTEKRYGAFDRLFGVESNEMPTSEAFYEQAIHPEDRERVEGLQRQERLQSHRELLEYEYRTHPDNGDVRWLRSEAYVQRDPDGTPRTLVGLATDITDHKLRQQERKRYEQIVEHADDGILVFDQRAQIVFLNERVVEESGLARDAWTGKHVSSLAELGAVAKPDVETLEAEIRALVREERSEARIELTTDDTCGDRTFELQLASFHADDDRRVIGYSRDITARKARERRFEQLQQRTRHLMTTSTLEETAQVAVDTAREVLGAELSGFHRVTDDGQRLELVTDAEKLASVFDALPQYDRTEQSDPVGSVVWETFQAGEPTIIDDTSTDDRLAGRTPANSAIIYPIADQGVFIVSATERAAFDETDKRFVDILGATLTAAIQRVSREALLRQRERDLEQQNERLDAFASAASHDLRNPLSVAQGHLELAREECDNDHLAAVARTHDRIETLIDDMLALARDGQTAIDTEPIALSEFVTRCWQTVERADADLRVDTTQTIRADRGRLAQLLKNLLGNAVEHGGDDVTVTVGDVDGGFYVADDGSGIAADEREHVFDIGYSTSAAGTGFGLSIVEQIADAHGWTITVTESADGGTRFVIRDVTVDN